MQRIKPKLQTTGPSVLRILCVLAVIVSILPPLPAKAASGDVILFWDTANGAIPSGWTCISCTAGDAFYQKFIRAQATYGATGGTDTVTHTFTPTSVGGASGVSNTVASGSVAKHNIGHSHTFNTFASGSSDIKPLFRQLNVIKKSNATTIPKNVIAMFKVVETSKLPAGWSAYTDMNASRFPYGENSTSNGGNASHTHTRAADTSSASSGAQGTAGLTAAAAPVHTHTVASGSTGSTNNLPSYVDLVFAKATNDISLQASRGLIALFDATAPSGWNSLSATGSAFENKFIRGNTVGGLTGGSDTHTHDGGTTGALASGGPSATANITTPGACCNVDTDTHTHNVTYSISTDTDNSLPPWRGAILAQYTGFSKLEQQAYIWENDDGVAVDSHTQLAGNNTAITALRGQRLNLRTHLKNIGTGASLDNLGLFYDRSDGIWSKVDASKPPITSAYSTCTSGSTAWDCTLVEATGTVGEYASIAIDPSGRPWVSYFDGGSNNNLRVAQYVGSGGTGCGGGSTAWSCTLVDATGTVGFNNTSIAFDPSGTPWVSYHDFTNKNLRVAQFVGSGGNCDDTGGSDAWTCTLVEASSDVGTYSSIAFDPSGNPWVSYFDDTSNFNLRVAQYVGSGGTGCGGGSTAWTCTLIDATGSVGGYTSIAIDPSGNPWVSYHDFTNANLKVAQFVGSGGNCVDTGGSAAWTCTLVEATNDVGLHSSIAFDPSGNPWVSYYEAAVTSCDNNPVSECSLHIAKYVGSGGSGCTGGSSAWTCSFIDNPISNNNSGSYTSLAFDPTGNPWVSYRNEASGTLRIARYVGTGGTGCTGNTIWTCTTIQGSNSVGQYSSLAFDPSGNPWISYYDSTALNLKVSKLSRSGEITMSPSTIASHGSVLTKSHADMTTYNDTTNRDDSGNDRCVTTSITANDGAVAIAPSSSLSIPAGSVTAQCTEVMFSIDTSNAIPGTTYRFVVATKDGWAQGKGAWRGPSTITQYATLTINANSEAILSKDNMPIFANCTDTAWGCEEISDPAGIDIGQYNSIAIDPSGNPWVSYSDTNQDLIVANYVGSGGDCDAGGAGTGSDAWNCTTVDTFPNFDTNRTSIAFDNSGIAWVAYTANNSLGSQIRVAKYVGSGGVGCGGGTTVWTCSIIESTSSEGISIAISPTGIPYIAYAAPSTGHIFVAKYVGSGGVGCDTTDWSCSVVYGGATSASDVPSIAINGDGSPWISFRDGTNDSAMVARYVGSGGGGCTGGATDWTCTTVYSNPAWNNTGIGSSMAFDKNGVASTSFHTDNGVGTDFVYYAQFVGSGGNCDTIISGSTGSDAWECTSVVSGTNSMGAAGTALAYDPSGNPWIAYAGDNRVAVSKFNGTSWVTVVSTLDGSTNIFQSVSMAFDNSGTPWVAYQDSDTNNTMNIAKLHLPPSTARPFAQFTNRGRSAVHGLARYLLDDGRYPASNPQNTCGAGANAMGYCGAFESQGQYDAITAATNARPVYVGAFKNFYGNDENSGLEFLPQINWVGQSNVAASSGNIVLQVYRFGSTNAWETLVTNTTCLANTNCTISAIPTGTASQYFETVGNDKWLYYRIYQVQGGTSITFKTDEFRVHATNKRLRGGRIFENGEDKKLRTIQ